VVTIGFGLLEVLFFTISWRVLTNYLEIRISVTRAYLYVWYGLYVDIIVPASSVSGEVTRTYLCTRDKCGPFGKVVASLFTHRLLGMTLNVAALIVGIVLLTFGGKVDPLIFNVIIIVAAAIVGIIGLMFVLSLKQQWTLKVVDFGTNIATKLTFGRMNLAKLREEAVEITLHFHDAMKEFRRPKLCGSLFFLIVAWFFSQVYPTQYSFSLGHPVLIIIVICIFSNSAIPIGYHLMLGFRRR
jgi:uncharacterized protein (TIRG00374 family)